MEGKIEFKNVNFAFDRSKKVLSNINLTIEPGDIVGIVGTTGSGKSTLINLLMRYYDEYDGEILVDGINIRDIDLRYYRNSIGFVQQEPLMFRDTIYNNIAYGRRMSMLSRCSTRLRSRTRTASSGVCPTHTTPCSASAESDSPAARSSAYL